MVSGYRITVSMENGPGNRSNSTLAFVYKGHLCVGRARVTDEGASTC
jgi:hypothetical protein